MAEARAVPQVRPSLSVTGVLMAEHRNIERILSCLEQMADEFERAGALDRALAGDALEFLRTYADRRHHGKEEAHLFPAMENHGLPADMGPTAVMRAEHDEGRGHVRDMGAAVEKGDLAGFTDAARRYVALLRDHIAGAAPVFSRIVFLRTGTWHQRGSNGPGRSGRPTAG